ncbi:MAG TPA: hypothetical protein PKD86_17090 [Gemmatales bacterium]|nr:hypothetical protein [Gemmatales bacterium]HMP61061.1 hypothetical protein [Gemmatales bacterium]
METTIRLNCPRCGAGGQVPSAYAGRSIHCKRCDTHFTVPQPKLADASDKKLPSLDDLNAVEEVGLAPMTKEEIEHEERVKAKLIHLMKGESKLEKA